MISRRPVSQPLLADRYHHRTHFTSELLQNTQDTLARWSAWQGSLSVQFDPHQPGPPHRSLRPAIGIEPRAQRRHIAREIGHTRALLGHINSGF
jgi:hypothetical protein